MWPSSATDSRFVAWQMGNPSIGIDAAWGIGIWSIWCCTARKMAWFDRYGCQNDEKRYNVRGRFHRRSQSHDVSIRFFYFFHRVLGRRFLSFYLPTENCNTPIWFNCMVCAPNIAQFTLSRNTWNMDLFWITSDVMKHHLSEIWDSCWTCAYRYKSICTFYSQIESLINSFTARRYAKGCLIWNVTTTFIEIWPRAIA